jgi:extracellular elastinolytic metalloproteinase
VGGWVLAVLAACVAAVAEQGDVHAQVAAAGVIGGNFDARIAYNLNYQPAAVASQDDVAASLRADFPEALVTFDDRTGVVRTLFSSGGYLSAADAGRGATDVAAEFVKTHLAALGLEPGDLDDAEITDIAINRTTGSTHWYLRQRYRGIPVYNGQLQVNINRDNRVLSVNNAFHPALAGAVKAFAPVVSAEAALMSAAGHLGIVTVASPAVLGAAADDQQVTQIAAPSVSKEPVKAVLMWLPVRRDDVRLVWNFQVYASDGIHIYDMTVDAVSGNVWTRFDWAASDQYKVYPRPVESPSHTTPAAPADGRVVVSNPADATASPFGWHDTNGIAGAEFTIMRGNNVHAYDDSANTNAPPSTQPDCGPSLVCTFSVDLTQAPAQYKSAAIANLFYWNNLIHDVQYRYGFTEAAGNFQVNNYGRGGAGNDDVKAEAQDGGGTSNANFATPPDGQRPTMQMYLWTLTSPQRDGDFDNGIIVHEYGHGISNRLVGGPSNVSCLNNNQEPGEGLSDWWALVYTARASDTGAMGRGVGTYALGEPTTGDGIRDRRYSTDPAVNPWTYASISGMAVPHGVGSVWAQVAWKMYWALVDTYGFDANLHNATGNAGNLRAMLYVNEGLMNTACSPTFTDVRDGIIQAATDNHGGQDVCTLWSAFAGMGLGTNAVSGGSNSTSPTNGFSIPVTCMANAPSLSIGDVSVTEGNSGATNATFTVSLSTAYSSTVMVDYATADATATSAATVANTGAVSIPGNGSASPYPSSLTVPSGFNALSKVTVTLKGFTHTYPSDVDVLLVGPGGQTVVLMSDAGSGGDVSNLTLTFDDAGPALTTGGLTSGTYKPTNIADGLGNDTYSSPAPTGTYGSTLAVFNGVDPAGTWRLFVRDDFSGDSGSFSGGWSLTLQSAVQDYSPASGSLSFAAGSTSRTLSVPINGDTVVEANETLAVNLTNAVNAVIGDSQGVATILNDDGTNMAPTISSVAGQSTSEDTATDAIAFTVSDAETQAANLTVSGSSSNTTLVPNAALTFGGSGSNRTVRATPAADQSGSATITLTVSDGNVTTSTAFALTVAAVNDPPTTSAIAAQTTTEGAATGAIAFTVGDVDTAAGSLTVSASSSNTALVPNAGVTFGGSGANRTLVATPAANQSGSATITVTVSDGNLTASTSFVLAVTAVDDRPTISAIAAQTTPEDTSTGAIAFTVGDMDTAAGSLTVSGSSSNTGLVPNASVTFGGSGANRTLVATPAPNQSGSTAVITVTVSDGNLTASTSFVLTVTAVDDRPTISAIAAQTTPEDTATGAIAFTVSDVDTAAGSLTVSGSSSNTSLVPNAGITFSGSGANRTLVATPAADQFGSATIAVTVSAGGLTESTSFVLTVAAADDPPTVSAIAAQTTTAGAPTGAIAFTVGDVDTAAGSLTVSGSSSNTALVPNAGVTFGGSGANRTLVATPAANQSGSATITVTVSDGSLTASTSFVVTVTAGNDRPTISAIADQITEEDRPTGALGFTVGDVETAVESLTMSGTSSNTALVPNAALAFAGTGASRTLTAIPAPNQSGSAAITVTVSDGGQTASTTFVLTVATVNDAPTVSAIVDRTTSGDGSPVVIPFTVGDVDNDAAALMVAGSTSNTTLVPNESLAVSGSGASRTVTVTPVARRLGTSTITITVSDGLAAVSRSFVLTVSFTDDPLIPGSAVMRAVHITELRAHIDLLRARRGLSSVSWTDSSLSAGRGVVRVQHITELRTALTQVYVATGLSEPKFTDESLTAGMSIRALHITELRAAVVALE